MIKKLLFVFLLASITTGLRAQLSKGSVFLGGSVSYYKYSSKTDIPSTTNDSRNFSIQPAVGLAVKDNLVIGIDMNYSNQKGSNKNTSIGGGIYARKYFPIVGRFFLFGQATLSGSHFSTSYYSTFPTDLKIKGYSIDLNLYPGVSFEVKHNLHLEAGFASLGYVSFNHSHRPDPAFEGFTDNSFSAGSNISSVSSFSLGLRYIVSRHK